MTPADRDDTWLAYRIVRATPGGRTDRKLRATAGPRVLRMVEVLPSRLNDNCLAEAWRLTALDVPA